MLKVDVVSIITSDLPSDDGLADFANHAGIECFRGDPDDVLSRMLAASNHYSLDNIISVTADNPWVCPFWAKNLLDFSLSRNLDYGRISGLPFGSFCYFLKKTAIQKACLIKATKDTEVWGGYFDEKFGFNSEVLEVPKNSAVHRPNYRLTVDTPEDFLLAEAIANRVEPRASSGVLTLGEIVEFLDSAPDVVGLNANIIQAVVTAIEVKQGI